MHATVRYQQKLIKTGRGTTPSNQYLRRRAHRYYEFCLDIRCFSIALWRPSPNARECERSYFQILVDKSFICDMRTASWINISGQQTFPCDRLFWHKRGLWCPLWLENSGENYKQHWNLLRCDNLTTKSISSTSKQTYKKTHLAGLQAMFIGSKQLKILPWM